VNMSKEIQRYQKRCWSGYKPAIGYPADRTYLYGTPIKVQVPVDTGTGGLFIVGAYPTAQFNTIGSLRDVPVGDHLYPFSNESYFDGSSVRTVRSGTELEEYYLRPLGVERTDCWITDLVKVFLFKDGHVTKYHSLGAPKRLKEDRSKFIHYASHHGNMEFLAQELELAAPKVVMLLGSEVAGVVLNGGGNGTKWLTEQEHALEMKGKSYRCFACPHPGILMRNTAGSIKWRKMLDRQLPLIARALAER
jgi:uracil-DNA glycosylase